MANLTALLAALGATVPAIQGIKKQGKAPIAAPVIPAAPAAPVAQEKANPLVQLLTALRNDPVADYNKTNALPDSPNNPFNNGWFKNPDPVIVNGGAPTLDQLGRNVAARGDRAGQQVIDRYNAAQGRLQPDGSKLVTSPYQATTTVDGLPVVGGGTGFEYNPRDTNRAAIEQKYGIPKQPDPVTTQPVEGGLPPNMLAGFMSGAVGGQMPVPTPFVPTPFNASTMEAEGGNQFLPTFPVAQEALTNNAPLPTTSPITMPTNRMSWLQGVTEGLQDGSTMDRIGAAGGGFFDWLNMPPAASTFVPNNGNPIDAINQAIAKKKAANRTPAR